MDQGQAYRFYRDLPRAQCIERRMTGEAALMLNVDRAALSYRQALREPGKPATAFSVTQL